MFWFVFLKISSREHFRSRLQCETFWNQSEGSELTQLKFRKCAASVSYTRLLSPHWRKYASRFSQVSNNWTFCGVIRIFVHDHNDMLPCLFFPCRFDTSGWPFAQTVGLHLWAWTSGGPQTFHGVSEQWYRRVQTASGYARALLWLLTSSYNVNLQSLLSLAYDGLDVNCTYDTLLKDPLTDLELNTLYGALRWHVVWCHIKKTELNFTEFWTILKCTKNKPLSNWRSSSPSPFFWTRLCTRWFGMASWVSVETIKFILTVSNLIEKGCFIFCVG